MKNQKPKVRKAKLLKNAGAKQVESRASVRCPNCGFAGGQQLTVKRPPLERMMKIFALLQAGKYPNCTTISELNGKSLKTSIRDIDFMRDRLELPIEYDDKKHGFYFTEPVKNFPMLPVTQKELFYVCVMHKGAEHYRGTPLEKPLELAWNRLAGKLDDVAQFTLQGLDELMSIRPFAPEDADLERFEIVTQGITERRLMKFQYRKPGEKASRPRRVHPYHMCEFGSRWYLIGYDVEQKKVRKYVLGRMRDAGLTGETFANRKGFDPKAYFSRSVGVVTGEGDFEVVIEMDAWLTDVLRGRRFHPEQVWTEVPGGGSHLQMRLNSLIEIEQHVLSWGTHANVVAPTELAQRVKATADELVKRYATVGAKRLMADGKLQGSLFAEAA